jgi:hypothetical protein
MSEHFSIEEGECGKGATISLWSRPIVPRIS